MGLLASYLQDHLADKSPVAEHILAEKSTNISLSSVVKRKRSLHSAHTSKFLRSQINAIQHEIPSAMRWPREHLFEGISTRRKPTELLEYRSKDIFVKIKMCIFLCKKKFLWRSLFASYCFRWFALIIIYAYQYHVRVWGRCCPDQAC